MDYFMECSRGSHLFSWGKGSLWKIIIYVVSLIGRGLLFISGPRQKKGTYLQPEHWKTEIGDRRESHHDPKCLGMCVMTLHCEGPWLTAKLKDQGWDYLPTNSIIYFSTA